MKNVDRKKIGKWIHAFFIVPVILGSVFRSVCRGFTGLFSVRAAVVLDDTDSDYYRANYPLWCCLFCCRYVLCPDLGLAR